MSPWSHTLYCILATRYLLLISATSATNGKQATFYLNFWTDIVQKSFLLSIWMHVWLYDCLPLWLPACLYVHLHICMTVCLPACLLVHMYACMFACLYVSLYACLSDHYFIHYVLYRAIYIVSIPLHILHCTGANVREYKIQAVFQLIFSNIFPLSSTKLLGCCANVWITYMVLFSCSL